MAPIPTPAAVADAMEAAALGADLPRLAEVCRIRADAFDAAGRQRLLDAAVSLDWAAQLLEILDCSETGEGANAGR